MSGFDTGATLGAALSLVSDAALLGWAATALFCAVAGVAVALWAGVPWWVGLLAGAVTLYAALLGLVLVGAVRAAQRGRETRALRAGPTPPTALPIAPPTALALPVATPPATGGVRARVRRGWRAWTRTPPTRSELAVAVALAAVAVGSVVATQLTWLTLTALGRGVFSVGPFAIQLGLFVVLSAVAAVVCAAGIVRWRSAWWPVLLAWFGAWWLFVGVEVLQAQGALGAVNRLIRDQVRERLGYDARPQVALGVGWTVMLGLAAAMMVLSVVLLVLQGRRGAHYRPVARP